MKRIRFADFCSYFGSLLKMGGGRVPEVDLADEVAARVLKENVPMASQASSLFAYSPLEFKRRARWDKLAPHTMVLSDLFLASGGFLIHQNTFEKQIKSFIVQVGMKHTAEEAAVVCYRLRVMMSHVRDAKAAGRPPPPQ